MRIWPVVIAVCFLAVLPARGESIRFQVSGGNASGGIDWMRLDLEERRVRLTHTTMNTRQIVFFPVTNWTDHPVAGVLFRPDGCDDLTSDTYLAGERLALLRQARDAGLIEAPEYAEAEATVRQKQMATARIRCLLIGTDALQLPEGVDVRRGTWTIFYALNDLSRRYLTFRVPPVGSSSIEADQLKARR